MKIFFLSFHGFNAHNGISKKKLAQIKGLKESGCSVVNCYYTVNPENGDRLWMADDKVLANLGSGIWAKIRKRIDYTPIRNYIKKQQIELVYMRSEHNASPFLIRFVQQLSSLGVKTVMEIPTYPYDQEYITFESKCFLFVDRMFRKRLAKELHAIVTFSNQKKIFGQRTIQISNGIDFSSIKLKENQNRVDELHLIGVAEIHYWHGFDRVVAGLANYYNNGPVDCRVYFHIVGDFSGEREKNEILPLIEEYHLEKFVILYGSLYGPDLDLLFDRSDIGIGSLGRHRSNITYIKTLKNREYAARGIPFLYSEIDDDFEKMPYILKVPADESPINTNRLIEFKRLVNETPEKIRNTVKHLSWKNQMEKVLIASNNFFNTYEK
ncbi:MAG: glycosyltransferase family 1 protein [Clostridia bacterium]|nr:glycosyltransferase family 1 protein [Clostridia bacterium]